jgi:iron complex transport system permease protein
VGLYFVHFCPKSAEKLGINAGAGFVAVTLIVLFPGVDAAIIPAAAFGGAQVVALLI